MKLFGFLPNKNRKILWFLKPLTKSRFIQKHFQNKLISPLGKWMSF